LRNRRPRAGTVGTSAAAQRRFTECRFTFAGVGRALRSRRCSRGRPKGRPGAGRPPIRTCHQAFRKGATIVRAGGFYGMNPGAFADQDHRLAVGVAQQRLPILEIAKRNALRQIRSRQFLVIPAHRFISLLGGQSVRTAGRQQRDKGWPLSARSGLSSTVRQAARSSALPAIPRQ